MQNNQNQAIWSPSRILGLSFLFTPIFGSYLVGANWRSLEQSEKAASAKRWLYASLLIIAILIGATAYFNGNHGIEKNTVRGIVDIVYISYFCVWGYATAGQQIMYVHKEFGTNYAKKKMFKPILCGLGLNVLWAFIFVGLSIAAQDINGDQRQQSTSQTSASSDQNSVPAARSPFGIASLFSSGPKLDCAAPTVKEYIANAYGKQLVATGVPDLVWAVQAKRVTMHVDTIHETARNDESKYVNCAANFVIDFPKDDLVRASQQGILGYLRLLHPFEPVTDSIVTVPITYQVAIPSDSDEEKQGPIITMTTKDDPSVEKLMGTYVIYYQALTFSTPDITSTSTNSTPWSKEFKDGVVHGCSKQAGAERCTCRINELEKFVGEKQMSRIVYGLQTGVLPNSPYPNFLKLMQALRQQCPLKQNLAAILGDNAAPTGDAASTSQQSQQSQQSVNPQTATNGQSDTSQVPAASTPAPISVAAPIHASFDCAKASSKIEKLICSTPQTGDADVRLAAAYHAAAAKSSDPATLRQQQRDWLKERNTCGDAACLLKVTEVRIQKLSAM